MVALAGRYPFQAGAFVALTLMSQLGCQLLLWLSRFGQNPFDTLPAAMVGMWGALLAGALWPLTRGWSSARTFTAVCAALLTNLILYLLLAGPAHPALYLLAPLTMLIVHVAFASLPGRLGEMTSAMSVFVVATVLANYTFDSFIPVGDFFLVNVGTFFFGVTFTQRDRVHRFGRPAVYLMILVAALANVATSLGLGTPLRYVAVAFLAILVAETVDTEVYARLVRRPWLARVASSNAVSAPVDTILFTTLAFWGEPFATSGWMIQVIVTDVLVKYGSGMIAALPVLGLLRARAPQPVAPGGA